MSLKPPSNFHEPHVRPSTLDRNHPWALYCTSCGGVLSLHVSREDAQGYAARHANSMGFDFATWRTFLGNRVVIPDPPLPR